MPRVVFCEELEGKLIELWAAEQKASNETMKKRSEIAVKLNFLATSCMAINFRMRSQCRLTAKRSSACTQEQQESCCGKERRF